VPKRWGPRQRDHFPSFATGPAHGTLYQPHEVKQATEPAGAFISFSHILCLLYLDCQLHRTRAASYNKYIHAFKTTGVVSRHNCTATESMKAELSCSARLSAA